MWYLARWLVVALQQSIRGGLAIAVGAWLYFAVYFAMAMASGVPFPVLTFDVLLTACLLALHHSFLLLVLQLDRFVACVAVLSIVIGACSAFVSSGLSWTRRVVTGGAIGIAFALMFLYVPSEDLPGRSGVCLPAPGSVVFGWWHVPLACLWGGFVGLLYPICPPSERILSAT